MKSHSQKSYIPKTLLAKTLAGRAVPKRSYLLFELLLAFFLLVAIFFPLLKTHFVITFQERKRIENIQFERLEKIGYAYLKQLFYENHNHSFEELKKGAEGVLPHKVTLFLGKNKTKECSIKYVLTPIEHCRRQSIKKSCLLVEAKLLFYSGSKVQHTSLKTFLLREEDEN